MKMEQRHFNERPGEEHFYHQEKPRAFWRRYFWQIIALVALGLAALFAFAAFHKSGVNSDTVDGVWSGQFAYYPGEPYSTPFQATLHIPLHQGGVFAGTLSEPVYGNSIVSVSGTEGGSSLFVQSQLQYVTQAYGNGTGVFVAFTDPTYTQGNQIELNCSYIAVVYADGSLHGVWFYPGSTQPDGTFILNKIA